MDPTALTSITFFVVLNHLFQLFQVIFLTFFEALTIEAINFMMDLLVKVASILSGLAGAFAILELLKDRRKNLRPIIIDRSRVIHMENPEHSILVLELHNRAPYEVIIQNAIVRQSPTYWIESSENGAPPALIDIPFRSDFFTESVASYPLEFPPSITKTIGFKAEEKATKEIVLDQADHILIDTSHGSYKLNIPSNIVLTDGVSFSTHSPKFETKNFVKSRVFLAKEYIKYLLQKVTS